MRVRERVRAKGKAHSCPPCREPHEPHYLGQCDPRARTTRALGAGRTDLVLGPDVQEDAVFVATLSEVGEEPALGHAVPVKLVQEVAVVALLAQPAQPVLTNDLVPPRVDSHAGRRLRLRLVGLDAEHGVEVHADLV